MNDTILNHPIKHWLELLGYLTPSEWEVFQHLGTGLSTRTIATIPGKVRSIKTVEAFYALIRKKLELKSIQEARALSAKLQMYAQLNGLEFKVDTICAIKYREVRMA